MMENKHIKKIILTVFLLLFCLTINISMFFCPVGGTTSFEVDVNDENGDGIEEADVEILDSDDNTVYSATADSSGILDVDNLEFESGEDYTITAEHEDHETKSKTGINFDENTDNTYTFSLSEDEPKPTGAKHLKKFPPKNFFI